MRSPTSIGARAGPCSRRTGCGCASPAQPAPNLALVGESLANLAKDQGYPPLVIRSLVDPSIEVWRVVSEKGTAERKFVTKQELDADREGEKKWGQPSLVKPAGQLLELTAEKAKDYGIATALVNSPDDPHELYAVYGVTRARDMASRITAAARSTAETSFNAPPNDPIGVRHALRMTASNASLTGTSKLTTIQTTKAQRSQRHEPQRHQDHKGHEEDTIGSHAF